MLTALLRWMNQSRKDKRSQTMHAPRLRKSPGGAFTRAYEAFLPSSLRQLWDETAVNRTLNLEAFEDRLLYSAAPAPMPAPTAVEVVVVAPVASTIIPADDADPAATDSLVEGSSTDVIDDQVAAQEPEQRVTETDDQSTGATLIVVDPTVEGYESLLDKLSSLQSGHTDLLVLDLQRDGLEQITERLEKLGETRAIHIISHGDEAGLHLGSNWLSGDTISMRVNTLTQWQSLLTADADLLFYGCDLAANASGQQFLQTIGELTGADVAASTNATGSAVLGGDWNLEYQYGSLQTSSLAEQVRLFDWNGLLTTNTYQQGSGGYTSSIDNSISAVSPNSSAGTANQVVVGGPASQTGLLMFSNLFGNSPGQIPYGSTITSASLRINVVSGTTTESTIGLYRVMDAGWTAASTWNSLGAGLSRDGVEVATVADAIVENTTQLGLLTMTGLQETLQSWSDGEVNNGWALYGDNATNWSFTSADGATSSLRPMLIVDYTPPSAVSVELRSTNEIRVNAVTANTQTTSTNSRNTHDSVGIDANGNYVVVWTNDSGDGSGAGVYGQRYNARGVAQGSLFRINQTTTDEQRWASVAVKQDGGYIVTWTSRGQDGSGDGVYARIFNASGVGGAEFRVNTTTSGDQLASSIGVSSDGSFVIAWEGNGTGDSSGVFAQQFDSSGAKVGSEFRVNTITTNGQSDVAIAVSNDGQFMVVWDDSVGTHGRRFLANGSGQDVADLLIHSDYTSGNADVATNGNGNYHVVWRTTGGGDGSGRGLWQINLNSTDLIPGTPVQVTASSVNDQTEPSITSAANGDYIITWQGAGPGDSAGVFARKFLSDGTPVGTEFQLNETSAGSQISVSGAMLDLENYVTVWSGNGPGDPSGIFARAYGTLANQSSLLFTTDSNVSASGSTSLTSWSTGDVLAIGEPNLALGDNTAGKLWIVGNINAVANDGNVKIEGLDVIQHDVLVAAGTKQIQLYAGDVLFSVGGTETLGGLTVQSDDILVFRPSAPWNYANGSILVLFDGLQSADGGQIKQMADFDLVDQDSLMGDVTLHAGDLIIADQGTGDPVIQLFEANTAGLGTTAGAVSMLLNGSEIGLGSEKIVGLQFVERDMWMGGKTFLSGDLLVSTRNDTTIGSNNLSITRNDVARLSVSRSSAYGTASVVASMAVDGSDVSLDTAQESIRALAMVHVGAPPNANDETYTISEDGTFSSQNQWDLPGWDSRMRLTFDNSTRAENLNDFPILVTLDTNRFDYSLAQANGADLRFVDADGTVLDYEIETWNPNGQSAIWVKIPRIDASSSSDHIWMYYGNEAASDAQNAAGVWSNGYVGVWHMNGNPSGSQTIQDSSASNVDGTSVGMDVSNQVNGPIGGALKFDGSSEYIRVATTATDPTAIDPSQLTIEAWAQSSGDTGTAERIINRRNTVWTTPYESYGLATSASDRSRLVNSTGTPNLVGSVGTLPEDRWRYVTGVLSGTTTSLYVDGVLDKTQTGVTSYGSSSDDITIGAGEMGLTSTISQFWKGGIDEVRLSNVARSTAWTSAQYASMIDAMVTYGDRQTFSGLLDNDTSPTNSPLTVSRVDLSGLAGDADVTVTDDGRIVVTPHAESLAAGQSLTREITYTVMDANGNSDLAMATIEIQGVNDAPVINSAIGPLTLSSIDEDSVTIGNTVASIIASAGGSLITDVDNGAVQGIAVTAVDQSHGVWQYSVDGSTWLSLSGVSDSSATLLNTTARIRFLPAADFNGPAGGITFRAWDQSAGTNGQTGVNASITGGSTAFSTLAASATIQVNTVNDAPTISTNTGLTIAEGGARILTSSQLLASDLDNTASELVYTVTTLPANGRLERVASPGTAISSFTQADINATAIRYVHNGSETTSDQFSFSVSDGALNTTGAFGIVVTPVNDAPTLAINAGITLLEGSNIVIESSKLTVSDPDNTAVQVIYTVTTSPSNGRLERADSPGTAITSFTQADVNSNAIRYVHLGSETVSDSFSFTASDGTGSTNGTFSISITPVNDPLTLTTNTGLTLAEGTNSVINAAKLAASDVDNTASQLVYTVTSMPSHGTLERITAPGAAITSFTQADLNSGSIRYAHDGGESSSDAIEFSVSDGTATVTGSFAISISAVNDAPTVTTNLGMTLAEGGTALIRNTNLLVGDVDNTPSQLVYTVTTSPSHGRLERVSAPGVSITSFSQADLNSLSIRYVHDGGETSSDSFSFSTSDGAASVTGSFTITITPVTDPPVITTNLGLTVAEGGAEVLNNSRLASSDLDTAAASLIYTMSASPSHGRLESIAAPGVSITSFTQADLNSGSIRYAHDGGESSSDAIEFSVSDGTATVTGSFAISISAVNDAPTVTTNLGMSLAEGGTALIRNTNLLVGDVDNTPSQLVYTVTTSPSYGRLEQVSAPGVSITSFSQADLNSLSIRYVHDGGETSSDSFSFSTSDGAASVTGSFTITITPVNDPPVITTNLGLTVAEGGAEVLNNSLLASSDPDTAAASLIYTMSASPSHGRLESVAAPGVSITSFTQSDLNSGLIRYVHDAGESSSDSFSFTMSDGNSTTSGSFSITITPVDDLPVIDTNLGLTLAEGQTGIISSAMLHTSDAESGPAELTYTVTNPLSFGYLALSSAPGDAITTFTQDQLNANQIIYVHSGAESSADYFNFSVSDGGHVLTGSFSITITPQNDSPVFDAFRMTLSEGQTVLLSSYNLLTNDNDTPASLLTYTVNSVTNGQFELVASPGTAITSFTQDDINSSRVKFIHDGSETSPTASLTVTDGVATVGPRTMLMTFSNVNDAPVVITNTGLTLNEGASAVIGSSKLAVTDADNSASQQVYTITTAPQHGRLEWITNPGVAIGSFTQAQINSGTIRYVHDGGETTADSFGFTLSDGTASVPGTFAISVNPVNDAPVMVNHSISLSEGQTITLAATNLQATDSDSDALTFMVSGVTHGRFVNLLTGLDVTSFTQGDVNDGVINFIHDGSEFAPTAMVSVTDLVKQSAGVAITFTMTPVNDAPVITPVTFQIRENASIGTIVGQVTVNDPDIGDSHTFSLIDGPSSSLFTIDSVTGVIRVADGALLDFESHPFHQLQVQVVDSGGLIAQETIQVQLENVNEAPVVVGLANVSGTEDQPIATIDLNAGWIDPESEGLTFQIVSMTNSGLFSAASISPLGQLILTGTPNASGNSLITLRAIDAHGLTATTTLDVTLAPVNDRPVANADSLATSYATAVVFTPASLLANDFDVDNSNLSVVIGQQPNNGVVTINPDGTFKYTPNSGFTGVDSFEYSAFDGTLLSTSAVVSVNVAGVTVAPSPTQPQSGTTDSETSTTSSVDSGEPASEGTASTANRTAEVDSLNAPSSNGSNSTNHSITDRSLVSIILMPHQDEDGGLITVHRRRQQSDESGLLGGGRSNSDSQRFNLRHSLKDSGTNDRLNHDNSLAHLSQNFSSARISPSLILALQSNQMAFEQVKESLQSDLANELVFEVPALAGASLSVGYVVWMLRGGVLVTSLLAQMPAWRIVDPLVVLESLDKCDEDDESIGSLVEQGQSEYEPAV